MEMNPIAALTRPGASSEVTKQSNGGRRSSSGGRGSDKGSSSDNFKAQYDADRYIHRKLEIFRANEEDLAKLSNRVQALLEVPKEDWETG
jgi:hypothetical protein